MKQCGNLKMSQFENEKIYHRVNGLDFRKNSSLRGDEAISAWNEQIAALCLPNG